ncbi:uncharacterized protein [Cherax quadricarinatus]|uniref:uncharacterized protein isoform X9 n=1 Tax=Cherax quadricarinatus TaxID=27406 RepID=UPI00387EBECC
MWTTGASTCGAGQFLCDWTLHLLYILCVVILIYGQIQHGRTGRLSWMALIPHPNREAFSCRRWILGRHLIKKHKCIKKAETAKKEIPSDNYGVLKYKRPDSEEDTQRKKKVQAKGRKGKRIFTEYDESSSPLQKKLKFRPNTGLILHMYGSRQQNAGVSWKVEWPKKWKYITITYSIDVLPQIHGHHNSDDTSIHNSPTSPLECTYYTFHLLMKLASLNPSIPGLSEYPWLSRHFSSKEDSSHRKLRDMYLFFLDKLCHKFNCKFAYVFLYLNLYDLFINN